MVCAQRHANYAHACPVMSSDFPCRVYKKTVYLEFLLCTTLEQTMASPSLAGQTFPSQKGRGETYERREGLETLDRFSSARPRFWPSQSDYSARVQQSLATIQCHVNTKCQVLNVSDMMTIKLKSKKL